MKRLSFKPLVLFSAMISIPAVAQQIDDAAKLKLLAETAESGRTKVSTDAKNASLLGIKFKFVGSELQIEADPALPLACAKQITLVVAEKPVADWKEKLKKSESIKDDELKEFSTEIVPSLEFSGVPAIRSLPECIAIAGKLEKADLAGQDKISVELKNAADPAYLNANGTLVKNAAYIKNENVAKKVNCATCKPEDILSGLDSDDRELFSTIVAKIETKIKDKGVEDLNNILLDHVTAVDSSASLEDLSTVRKGLKKFEADLKRATVSDSVKADLLKKVAVIRSEGIADKAKKVCKEIASGNLTAKSDDTTASTWSKVNSYFTPKTELPSASVGSSCAKFISDTMKEAANTEGLSSGLKSQFRTIADQLVIKNSNTRLLTLYDIDDKDPEVVIAKQNAIADFQRSQVEMQNNKQYLLTQCGANPNNPVAYNVMFRRDLYPQQQANLAVQCDIAARNFALGYGRSEKSGKLLADLGLPVAPQLAGDSMGFNGFNMSYSRTGSQYDPYQLSPTVFGTSAQTINNNNRNTAYQGINSDNFYRLNQQNSASGVQVINNGQVPVAIPLRMQMS